MGRFVARLGEVALAFGAPGLFIVAVLDSSFLSLPEIADLLVVWMVTQHKSLAVLYAASATLGSLTGCMILYYVGRKGGAALVRKRFASATVDRTIAAFQRYGVMAVLVPSLLPPPAPFKIFVLAAGLAGISPGRFATAIVIGRGLRYGVLAILAVRYGDRAIVFMRENGGVTALAVVGILAAGFIGYLLWSKAQERDGR